MGRIRQRLLRISPEETSFERRRFRCRDGSVRARLEGVGRAFVRGYTEALGDDAPARLGARLESLPAEQRGFAYEGAALALSLLDLLAPWKRGRLARFLAGPGAHQVYLMHVGAGWLLARAPVRPASLLRRLDPLLGWLALDGYGFHQGFFHWPEAVDGQQVPPRLAGYARRAFDQGLGRSLWFVDGADVERIPATLAAFPQARRSDLWSGVGLGCAYAGGRDRAAIAALCRAAGPFAPDLAQGAAFAAKARAFAGEDFEHTRLACQVLCGMDLAGAAAVTDDALQGLPSDDSVPAFEVWRRRIRDRFHASREAKAS